MLFMSAELLNMNAVLVVSGKSMILDSRYSAVSGRHDQSVRTQQVSDSTSHHTLSKKGDSEVLKSSCYITRTRYIPICSCRVGSNCELNGMRMEDYWRDDEVTIGSRYHQYWV